MFDKASKILVVDDMLIMRKIITKALKELGYDNVEEANDGSVAWEKILASQPVYNLIISDWNMPTMTGLELLKRVRADQKYNKTPFLMVTAEAEKQQIVEALGSGVDSYVIKPFSPADLTEKLQQVYKKRAAA